MIKAYLKKLQKEVEIENKINERKKNIKEDFKNYNFANSFGFISFDSIKKNVKVIDSFLEQIRKKEDELGLTDADVYNKANIERKTFNKYINDGVRPNKDNCVKIALTLKMNLEEKENLLSSIDKVFNKNLYRDGIICYFIEQGEHDLNKINDYLEAFECEYLL